MQCLRRDLDGGVVMLVAVRKPHWIVRQIVNIGPHRRGQRTMAMTGTQPRKPAEKRQLTAEEADLIKTLERLEGRKLTEQEINLSLDQARAIGEL